MCLIEFAAATPILGGRRGRETLNALEKIKNTVLNEERTSHMRTLGANNEFTRGPQQGRSTLDTKSRRRPALDAVTSAYDNSAFIARSSDEEDQGSELREMQETIFPSDSKRGVRRNVSQM